MLHAIFLALIQGVTEFLPISSSAHLLLPKEILGWPDQGLAFDVAVHVGTLCAVVAYLRREVSDLIVGGVQTLTGKVTPEGRLAWYLVIATIPVCIAGVLMESLIETHLRSAQVIAWATFLGAILLWVAQKWNRADKEMAQITLMAALLIGASQILALVPGTSRAGITITTALLLGFTPNSAARFSFLLSIPVIFLSGVWQGIELISIAHYPWMELIVGIVVSGVTAYFTIHYFLLLVQRIGMMPFVLYRIGLAIVLWTLV